MNSAILRLALPVMLLTVVSASAITHYVDVNNTNPVAPFTNWTTAATVIQDAVDAAAAGDRVLITNGVYNTGGKAIYATMTNRVAVDKPLTLQSVNGPDLTVIQGYRAPSAWATAIRCVYLTDGAFLSGFSLIDGSTQDTRTSRPETENGGGVYCTGVSAVISNCVISGNTARWHGGGCYSGTLINCRISGNAAAIGGGGASQSILSGCLVISNSASRNWGGGTSGCILSNCLVLGNQAGHGGGSHDSSLINCTVFNNSAMSSGGGIRGGTLVNCIVRSNSGDNYSGGSWNYSSTTPLPTGGIGNITAAPLFVDTNSWADFRLQSNSPCINAGNNAYVASANDLDGSPRIVGGTVDMGAYEFQSPQSMISYAWLQQYGLPTDGSADFIDGDSDSANTWQEWKAWTNPTNDLSVLRLLNLQSGTNGTLVSWESVSGHRYLLERATNMSASFSLIQSNIVGQGETTSVTDTNTTGDGPFLYRVAVPE